LDDYLLQLRFGRKFAFDFSTNRDEKVGVLRHFVKEEKDKIKAVNGGAKISSKTEKGDIGFTVPLGEEFDFYDDEDE